MNSVDRIGRVIRSLGHPVPEDLNSSPLRFHFTIKMSDMQGALLFYDDTAELFSLTLPEAGVVIPIRHVFKTSEGTRIPIQIRNAGKKRTAIEELQFEANNIPIIKFSPVSDTRVEELLKSLK